MVIDIARLDENSQSFVFGSVARAIYEMKLGADRDNIPDKIILFVDELNKYASNDIPKTPQFYVNYWKSQSEADH